MSDFLKLITRIPEGETPQFLHYCVSSEGLSLHASSPSGTPIKCDKKGIIKGAALGGCYIIEVTSCAIPLPSGVYPYRTISMSELFISKVEHE